MARIESKPTSANVRLDGLTTVKIPLAPKDANGDVLDLTGATLDSAFATSAPMAALEMNGVDASGSMSISGAGATGCDLIIEVGDQSDIAELVYNTAFTIAVQLDKAGDSIFAGVLSVTFDTSKLHLGA